MKATVWFGGAMVELAISSALEETAANPKVAATMMGFLEAYRLAHDYGEGAAFEAGCAAFLDEVIDFLEARYLTKKTVMESPDEDDITAFFDDDQRSPGKPGKHKQ
jgi:hypothetical protein